MTKEQMVTEFIEIAKDAQGAGGRVLEGWSKNPKKFLSKDIVGVESILRDLSPQQVEMVRQLVDYFSKTSFYYLFKRLEEGEGSYDFALQMKDAESGEVCELISYEEDLDIRNKIF